MPYLLLFCVILVGVASVIAIGILQRRGMKGAPIAMLPIIGAGCSFFVLAPQWLPAGIFGVVLMGVSCLGLIPPRITRDRCPTCGYDLQHEDERSGTRCPECGTPRPSMDGQCLGCRADIRSAVAGGTDRCPHCGEPVALGGD